MNPPPGTGPVSRHNFEDVHALGKLAGFELDFRKLSEGAPDVPTTLVTGENAVIVDMTLHAAFHQRGMAPRGAVTVGIPRRPLSTWFNGPYSRSAILPFNATGGIDAISQNDFVASVLSVSESFLRDVAEQHQFFSVPARV